MANWKVDMYANDMGYLDLSHLSPQELEDIDCLRNQLTSRSLKVDIELAWVRMRIGGNKCFFVVRDKGHIIGMTLLVFQETWTFCSGVIHNVVVDEKYRGQGVGEAILRRVIAEAKKRRLDRVELTSHSDRKEAIRLYERLGTMVDTNMFRLTF